MKEIKILKIMKRTSLSLVLLLSITSAVFAQKNMQVYKFKNFYLHVYTSSEAMEDVSIIIEGENELVILEQPSFYNSIKEFNTHVKELKKPIVKVIADYHTGGLADIDPELVVMIEGMPEFEKGEIYSGMIKNFSEIFAGSMDTREHKITATVPKNSIQKWAGIDFKFSPGSVSDFPGASINIGGKVYYSHFAPVIAHFSNLQINSKEAIDALLSELGNAKKSGCELFVGSHGIPTDIKAVDFQIEYLKKMKEILNSSVSEESFISAISKVFPNLPGEKNLKSIAEILYK